MINLWPIDSQASVAISTLPFGNGNEMCMSLLQSAAGVSPPPGRSPKR